MHWETKNFEGLALLQYSSYCSGLETNPNISEVFLLGIIIAIFLLLIAAVLQLFHNS